MFNYFAVGLYELLVKSQNIWCQSGKKQLRRPDKKLEYINRWNGFSNLANFGKDWPITKKTQCAVKCCRQSAYRAFFRLSSILNSIAWRVSRLWNSIFLSVNMCRWLFCSVDSDTMYVLDSTATPADLSETLHASLEWRAWNIKKKKTSNSLHTDTHMFTYRIPLTWPHKLPLFCGAFRVFAIISWILGKPLRG